MPTWFQLMPKDLAGMAATNLTPMAAIRNTSRTSNVVVRERVEQRSEHHLINISFAGI
jgi:hypothetical protein